VLNAVDRSADSDLILVPVAVRAALVNADKSAPSIWLIVAYKELLVVSEAV